MSLPTSSGIERAVERDVQEARFWGDQQLAAARKPASPVPLAIMAAPASPYPRAPSPLRRSAPTSVGLRDADDWDEDGRFYRWREQLSEDVWWADVTVPVCAGPPALWKRVFLQEQRQIFTVIGCAFDINSPHGQVKLRLC